MDDMARKIVREYKELMHGTVKEQISPGYPSIKLTKANPDKKMMKKDTCQLLGRSCTQLTKLYQYV